MKQSEQSLLELLKCALFGGEPQLPPDPPWEEIFEEAKHQTVAAIAAKALPASVPPEEKKQWDQLVLSQLSHYIRYLSAEDSLIKCLFEAEIPFVILKGTAAAVYYPEPYRRAMGDIDFLVSRESFDSVNELMRMSGYQEKVSAAEHEGSPRHTEFQKLGIPFEPHHHFSEDNPETDELIFSGFGHSVIGTVDDHSFPMLPKLSNGIVLLEHMKSHLRRGMGLRQLLDWMMYVNSELDNAFWDSTFSCAAEQAGLASLAKTVTRSCQLFLGLPSAVTWCCDAEDSDCLLLMDCILSSGNFGRKNGEGAKVEMVSAQFHGRGIFRRLQEAGEYNWKAYQNHPWLKPLCPVYQGFRYLRQGIQSRKSGNSMKDDLQRGKRRHELLKKLGIEQKN